MIYRVKINKKWNKSLAYFLGLLVGDGSLPNANTLRPNGKYQKRYIIDFVSNSLNFLNEIYLPLFNKLFGLIPKIRVVQGKKNLLYNSRIESKKIYLFLKDIGYITGKKARIAKVPKMPEKYLFYFLAGLLDTDGGKKGNGFGLSTSSPYLAKFCEKMFKKINLKYNSCPWKYRDHIYHQIYLPKKEMHRLLKHIPLKNKEKIAFIKGMPPWLSGRVSPW